MLYLPDFCHELCHPLFSQEYNQLRTIAAHAPVARGHINMLEEYGFAEEKLNDVLGIHLPKSAI